MSFRRDTRTRSVVVKLEDKEGKISAESVSRLLSSVSKNASAHGFLGTGHEFKDGAEHFGFTKIHTRSYGWNYYDVSWKPSPEQVSEVDLVITLSKGSSFNARDDLTQLKSLIEQEAVGSRKEAVKSSAVQG